MKELTLANEEGNRIVGWVVSIIFHLLLLLLFMVNFLNFTPPEPGTQGILVALGTPDAGGGSEEAIDEELLEEADPQEAPKEETAPQKEVQAEPEETKVSTNKVKPKQETSEVVVEEKEQKKEETPIISEEEKQRLQEEAEAKRRREEEARKKKEYEERKKKFGSLLSNKGEGNESGNQGDPSGDPDASVLDEIAKGSGKVGGGLSNRGVLYEPAINENSQKSGTVVIKICVDAEGKVIEADFTQRGSTTADISLVNTAKKAAEQYKFTAADIEKQCGTVTIKFILK